MTRRAMYITPETTIMDDGTRWATPPDALTGELGPFLDRLGRVFAAAGEGVILLNGPAAAAVSPSLVEPADHPIEVNGWKCNRVADWTTFYGEDRPTLRLCMTHLMPRPVTIPLWANGPEETLAALALWHRLTGSAYHGTPGMAATSVLSALSPKGKGTPTWKPRNTGPDGFEDDYHTDQWRAKPTGKMYVHGYDANRAYMAAAANVLIAKTMLRRGPRVFDPKQKLAGWWLVELSRWTDDRLPDPAGYDPHGKTVRWITSPTLALLEELTQEGVYGGVRILESWTAPGTTLLRPVAHRLRDAYAGKDPQGRPAFSSHPPERVARVRQTIKDAGRAMLGSFNSPSNWIYRPDWWYSVIAMDRCNRWRKIYRTTGHNRWPAFIDVDNVWYATDEPDWKKAAPPGWEIDESGLKLGHYKHGGTKKSRRWKK